MRPVLMGTCLLVLLAGPAVAGLRSRTLPPLADAVEPTLAARARTTAGARIHAVIRVPRGERRDAEAAGVRLLHSLRGELWLASLPTGPLAREEAPGGVTAAWELREVDRRPPELAHRLEATPDAQVVLRVKTFADADPQAVIDVVAREGGQVLLAAERAGVFDARVPGRALPALTAIDAVRWVELAPGEAADQNDGVRFDARVYAVQDAGFLGSQVTFGAWESGVPDTTHLDLAGRVTTGQSGVMATGHATHVAGILLGDGSQSQFHGGVPNQWRGIAAAADLVSWSLAGWLAEMDTAVAVHDIDIANHSWTYVVNDLNCELYGDYASDAPELDAIVRGLYGKAVPIVFAAGNERDDGDCSIVANGGYRTIPPPSTAKNVIAVGAHFSDVMHMTPFSSWGPTDDGRMKPDVSAPGCDQFGDLGVTSTALGGGYMAMCGTSMSAPAVSGAIGLLYETWRAILPGNPLPATSKALLGGFAQDRAGAGPDYRFGLGAIDVESSVEALRTATTIEDSVTDLGSDTWNFTVPPGTSRIRITLAWDDPPAAELADTTLVNDLDLVLIDPSAGTHLPFVLDPANPLSLAVAGVNRLDNVEQVEVKSPTAGAWMAIVTGTSVPLGPQSYSLVGFDERPPADPASLVVSAVDDTTVSVAWIRAGDTDRAGTLVVRSTMPITWTPVDATSYAPGTEPSPDVFVVAVDDTDHSNAPLLDEALLPGTTYHYALFSYDEVPNYSVGVAGAATTSSDAVSVPVVAASGRVTLRLAGANPSRTSVPLRLELPATTRVELAVHDVSGRRVATVLHGERTAGSHLVEWDGRRSDGQPAAGGIYFLRLRAGAATHTQKVLLVR